MAYNTFWRRVCQVRSQKQNCLWWASCGVGGYSQVRGYFFVFSNFSDRVYCESLSAIIAGDKAKLEARSWTMVEPQVEVIACEGCVMCLKYISLQAISMVSTVRQMKLSTARALGCFFS